MVNDKQFGETKYTALVDCLWIRSRSRMVKLNYSPIYTAENVWRGLDESGTRTKKIVLITHLHVLFSTVLNDVKL